MNKIEITNDQWLLTDHMGAIFTFTGTTNERIAALKKQLEKNQEGGILSDLFVFTNEEGTFSLDQWLTEKLNRAFVCGTEESFEEKRLEIPWQLEYYGYTPGKDEYSVESLLTVGNGFIGLRGTTPEMEISDANYPGLYLASLYNTAESEVSDRTITNEDFVNAPNLQKIYLVIDNEKIDIAQNTLLSFKRQLNLKTGLFTSFAEIETQTKKQLRIETQKIANMENSHHYSILYRFTPLNFTGEIDVISEADGSVYNYNVARYRSLTNKHLTIQTTEYFKSKALLIARTNQSDITVCQASQLFSDDFSLETLKSEKTAEKVIQKLTISAEKNRTYTLEKSVTVAKYQMGEQTTTSKLALLSLPRFKEMYAESKEAWRKLWENAAITIDGDLMSQKMLNLHTYHLLVSAAPNAYEQSLDASITARGLHGEAYRGHIFWDELFIIPFYILHFPKTAREILLYRYQRLTAAKKAAKEAGYQGAMFPWQSGLDGTEQSQELHLNPISGEWKEDHSRLQRHVSLAIAYNVWQYWHNVRDRSFMEQYGLELILEIAHFWQSAATLDSVTGRYSIEGVMGPDEFHESYPNSQKGGLKNNAYTNMMVVWLFEEVEKLRNQLSPEIFQSVAAKVQLSEDNFSQMSDIRKNLSLEINPEGIIAQFEGYFDLKDLDWDHYREKYGNIYRMDRILNAEGKSADAYKVAKQADSLMIFYNFSTAQVHQILDDLTYRLPEDYVEKNLHYYLTRTSHGSTLSRVVHSQLAAMVDQQDLAWSLYQEALYSDYRDIQGGTTAEGIHAGVMAATLYIPLTTFAGIDFREDVMRIDPNLPKQWQNIQFNIQVRGINYHFNVTHETLTVVADQNTTIILSGATHELKANKEQSINY
ncbi:glycoside hydrolase family 65 protein [Enterococcus gallinarum]|uniref:glycoside hydrolase family 65 protein n=1 Tax=Enterococcus gallinarum TaxID=1353 RepID=UPI0018AC1310|nr:glycoside hydrolase family 65 protein [Enterococcus gallinarum]MBO6418499.1 glycoside hydrolase family 65 protein [Enterococcus gallinarum]MBO6422674.1 glycoside hydrolase family 65 protein [Enterococcus gallinarum]MDT2683178.1 glycoside hydrolase family 65 protein [Enterococcus gallinarum]